MTLLPSQTTCEYTEPLPVVPTPVEEYISIMRSYLTEEQKSAVRLCVEKICLLEGIIPPMRYCDILQSQLTPCQRAAVIERLELALHEYV